MIYLLYVIYLYHDYTDRLVVGVVVDLGNVPIVGEEDEELVGIAVVETSLRLVVIIMDHVRTILAVGLAGKVVDDAEPLHALHDILEVDVLVVALALSLLQRSVLAVFYADGEVGARNLMLALWNRQEIGFGDVFEGDFVVVRGVVFFFDFFDFDGILFADEGFIGDAIASEAMGDRLGKIKKETGKW